MDEAQLKQIIKWVRDSKDAMRIKYEVWNRSKEIVKKHKKKRSWTQKVIVSRITASTKPLVRYTPERFNELLINRDHETAVNHLVWILSLWEALIKHVLVKKYRVPKKIMKETKIDGFLLFLSFKRFISKKERRELKVAQVFRNSFVHNGGQATEKEIRYYKNLRKGKRPLVVNGILNPNLRDIEPWNDMIINSTEKMIKEYDLD